MLNLLIVEDNLNYATNLMNAINKKNDNIKVCGIAKNGEEAILELNNSSNIDVILLDLKMPKCNGIEVLEKIKNESKYENAFIVISGELELISKLRDNKMINSITYKGNGIEDVVDKVNKIFKNKEKIKKNNECRNKIIEELDYLGYDMSYKGTKYLIDTIEYVIQNKNKEVCNLEKNVYPIISKKYNDSIHNIKCNIGRANDNMYYDCHAEKLKKYFHFDKDTKPKIKTVINVITNKIL